MLGIRMARSLWRKDGQWLVTYQDEEGNTHTRQTSSLLVALAWQG